MQYLKVLQDNNLSTHQNYKWPLPVQLADGTWQASEWVEAPEGAIALCRNGLHVCTEQQLWQHWAKWGMSVWVAECEGESAHDDEKSAFRRVRLLEPYQFPQWWLDTVLSIAQYKDIPYCKPDGNPKPEWKLFTAPTLAGARDAAWDAAWDAARDAAWDAARDAAWDAARDAAGDAAGDAARDAAWAGARAAARAAAWDAYMSLTSDLNVAQVHRDHIKARMEVWRKGYCLLCDVDGVLYVYAKAQS